MSEIEAHFLFEKPQVETCRSEGCAPRVALGSVAGPPGSKDPTHFSFFDVIQCVVVYFSMLARTESAALCAAGSNAGCASDSTNGNIGGVRPLLATLCSCKPIMNPEILGRPVLGCIEADF